MPDATLAVNEIFGPTIQGEGPSIGRPAVFLRLQGCNLRCSWCDTKYTYDGSEKPALMPFGAVIETIQNMSLGCTKLVVCTGGEPLLQSAELNELRDMMPGWDFEYETNGTIPLPGNYSNQWYIVSPKLEHSGVSLEKRFKPEVLKSYVAHANSRFKFVVKMKTDLIEVQSIVDEIGIPDNYVYIMPEGIDGTTIHDRTQDLVEGVILRGWNITTRLHTWIWGNARKR